MDKNIRVSKEQFHFLKAVKKKKEYVFQSNEMNMVVYLCQIGLLIQYTKSSHLTYCKLTEFGKAYLYASKIEKRRWRIPVIISIVALVVSMAAIVLSPFFDAFFTSLYGL